MEHKSFFYPYCCQLCKKCGVKLGICNGCRMISYCSEEHQQQHWPQHKELCKAIKLVLENKEYMNTKEISEEEWQDIRSDYMNKVSVKLERVLKNDEIQMFRFPKSCAVCHRQDNVIRCKGCPNAAFCKKHKDDVEHREKYCKLLKESFEVCQYSNLTQPLDISYVQRFSNGTLFNDIHSFLNTYVPSDNVYLQMLHSNLVTYPLTVYFCIRKLYHLRCEIISIHIIGRHVIRSQDEIELWKMLLIFIPSLTTLTITFIQNKELSSNCDISTEIVWQTKKLVANVRYMSYEEYMSTTDYKKPNFIIGFNARIKYSHYAARKCVDISALAGQMCPCILIFQYLYSIEIEVLHKVNKHFFGPNPFRSLIPYRHFQSETVYYPYAYVTIFNDLDPSKLFIEGNRCLLVPITIEE